jgi:histidine phosphotransferase ChpT
MRSDELLAESVAELRLRLRLYAAVFGEADAMRWEELRELLGGSPAAHRVAFEFETAGPATLPAPLAQLVLAAAMLGAEALPRGGSVRLAAAPGGSITILPEGRVAQWPHSLLERLAGMPPKEPDRARALLAPWMLTLAGLAGMQVSVGLGGPGIPPLLLRAVA